MKQLSITFLLAVLMGMIGAKAYAHIEVKNADGVTIYYNWINNSTELEVTGVYYGYYYDCGDDHYFFSDFDRYLSYYHRNYYSGKVVIPESVQYNGKTYSVTGIEGRHDVNVYPEGQYNIGGSESAELHSIIYYTFGVGAFDDCTGLTSITIPNSVTSIGEYAFYGCI